MVSHLSSKILEDLKIEKKNKWIDYCYASVKSKAIYSSIFKEMSGI